MTATPARVVLATAVVASAGLWVILYHGVPLFEIVPYWFWRPTRAPRPDWWLAIPLSALLLGAVAFVQHLRLRPAATLLLLILVGVAVQHGFALTEGRGLDGIRDRMVLAGHSRFVRDAIRQRSMLEVASSYQQLLRKGGILPYPNATKPPGQLIFYMATDRLAQLFPINDLTFGKLVMVACFVWPLLCYLPLLPVYSIARRSRVKPILRVSLWDG